MQDMAASYRLPCYDKFLISVTITLALFTLESLIVAVPTHCKTLKSLQYFVLSKNIALTVLLLNPSMHNENNVLVILFPTPVGPQKHHQTFRNPQINLEFFTWITNAFSKLVLVCQCFSLYFCREQYNWKETSPHHHITILPFQRYAQIMSI